MQLWKDGCQLLIVVHIYNGYRRRLPSTIASRNIYLFTFFTRIFLLTEKMATIIANPKATNHVRSFSLPSRSHPLTLDVEAQLDRLRSSQQTSSSSACQKLSGLKDLFECMDDLLQLPLTVQALSDEQNFRSVECVLDGSLRLLDACNTTKDAFSQLKDCVKELESSLRRKRGGESGLSDEIEAYRITRKNLKQVITKTLKSLKAMEKKNVLDSSSVAIFSILKDVEEVSTSVFASVLSWISSSMGTSRQGGWSVVSKLLQSKRVSSKTEADASEVANMDAELLALKSSKNISPEQIQNVLQGLQSLESSLQEVEEELDCVYRRLVKTRVSLLNIYNH